MKYRTTFIILLIALGFAGTVQADASYKLEKDIPYYASDSRSTDEYIRERCKLDIYYPVGAENFPTIVWFHGGGLTSGSKGIPHALKEKGVAVVAVNYRLSPKVKVKDCLEDAAAAVAWTFNHIGEYGGLESEIFVSGHSAGGYLTLMVGLNEDLLRRWKIEANDIAGLIPFSGHTITHFTARSERGIPGHQPIVDELAPLFYVRPDASPLLLITGDRELELLGRYEENAYMMRMMKVAGHEETELFELDGYGHNMLYPAFPLLLKEVNRISARKTDQ